MISVFFEPTSKHKCTKIVDAEILPFITFIKPNIDELRELATTISKKNGSSLEITNINSCLEVLLKSGLQNILLTLGEDGIKFARLEGGSVSITSFDAHKVSSVVSVCISI